MPAAVDIVDRLQRVAGRLHASADPDDQWVAEGISLWLAGAPIEATFALRPGWREALRFRRQQTALAGMRAMLPPMSTRSMAVALSLRLGRYAATAWRHDRATGRRPAGTTGLFYDFLAAAGSANPETLRKHLAGWVNEPDDVTRRGA